MGGLYCGVYFLLFPVSEQVLAARVDPLPLLWDTIHRHFLMHDTQDASVLEAYPVVPATPNP
jgi:hypothetical protein